MANILESEMLQSAQNVLFILGILENDSLLASTQLFYVSDIGHDRIAIDPIGIDRC
jgi:hypothetical protein